MTQHIYIKLRFMLWKEQRERFAHVLDEESDYDEMPNSLSGIPYERHPQFTISIFGNKITVWSDVNNPEDDDLI